MMVCFDEHCVRVDALVADPTTSEPLQRYVVLSEDGREMARFVLPASAAPTRWEIQSAAKEALKQARRRHRAPRPVPLVG